MKPLIPPLVLSTILAQESPRQEGYIRIDNPTRLNLEARLAELEKAKFALAFSSGSMAIASVLLSLKNGNHVLGHHELYEGTIRLLKSVLKKFGVSFTLTDLASNLKWKKLLRKETKLIWLENITNPTLTPIGVSEIAKTVKGREITIVVDNTFATPFFKKPLTEGADLVVHSLTKFINGHNDVLGGAIMTNNRKLYLKIKSIQQTIGGVLSPFDSFLVLRGMETFSLRMKKHTANAKKIVHFLRTCPKVEKVSYPGFSGVVTFWLKKEFSPQKFLQRLKHIKIAHSFGGTKTTILHPFSMMKFSFSRKKLEKLAITEQLLRLSVGIENPKLIINDLSWLKS